MHTFLDSSTSTSRTSGIYLKPGRWKFRMVATDAATVLIEEASKGGSDWSKVGKNGAFSLSQDEASVIVESTGEDFAVTRSGGSNAVTVTANPADEED